jgi:hypothetical protein
VKIAADTGFQSTLLQGGEPYGPFGADGVAVDAAGDVFITFDVDSVVYEVPAHGVGPIYVNVFANYPTGVAVDAAGNVFVVDSLFRTVGELPADGRPEIFLQIPPAFFSPYGIAVNGAGNVFLTDVYSNGALELQGSKPPTLNFGTAPVGSTSSPQSITAQNVGNQPLEAVSPGLIVQKNFLQVAGSRTPQDCTNTFSLTRGASCNLSLVFDPQVAGSISNSAIFTDNALNVIPARQSVKLKGVGTN